MHANRLADVAATIAFQSPAILRSRRPDRAQPLHDYYLASRRRSEAWHRVLHEAARLEAVGDIMGLRYWWNIAEPTIQEVFVTELMSRIFGGLAVAWESELAEPELGPIARSVFVTHLEARGRVMRLMLAGKGAPVDTSVRLNHLRALTERWSDLLLGQMLPAAPDVIHFAVEPRRCRQYGRDAKETTRHISSHTVGWLLSLSLRDGLHRAADAAPACPEENRKVAGAILNLLDADSFDALGRMKSVLAYRVANQGERTEASIEQILAETDAPIDAAADVLGGRPLPHKRIG